MSTKPRILIVEDEADLADLLGYNLRRAGYETDVVHDGLAAVSRIGDALPDLVLLDVMLPSLSGLHVARQVRADPKTASIPIIMLTTKAAEVDQVTGLHAGADDYLAKPVSTRLLLARVEAALRRTKVSAAAAAGQSDVLTVAPIRADVSTHQAWVGESEVRLTLTEFKLLVAMLRKPGKVIRRADLMYSAMGPDVLVTPRTIDVHVASIRRKLGEAGSMIRTTRGVGYMLTREGPSQPE